MLGLEIFLKTFANFTVVVDYWWWTIRWRAFVVVDRPSRTSRSAVHSAKAVAEIFDRVLSWVGDCSRC